MNAELKKLPRLWRELTVQIPKADVLNSYHKTIARKQKTLHINGFRKGKVPKSIIEQRFLPEILDLTSQSLVDHSFSQAIKQHQLQLAYTPDFKNSPLDLAKDFSYTVKFEIRPTVKLLSNDDFSLKNIDIKLEPKQLELKIKEIELELSNYREVKTAAQAYDRAFVVIKGLHQGQVFYNEEGKQQYIQLGLNQVLPEIEQAITGLKPGANKNLEHQHPQGAEHGKLAGKLVNYEIKLVKIERPDDFNWDAQAYAKVNPQITSLAELKDYVAKHLQQGIDQQIRQEKRGQLKQQLLKKLNFALPDRVVSDSIAAYRRADPLYQQLQMGLAQSNQNKQHKIRLKEKDQTDEIIITVEDCKKRLEVLEAKFTQEAEQKNRLSYYVAEVANQHKYQPDQVRVERAFVEVAHSLKMDPKELIKSDMGDRLYQSLLAENLEQQVLDWHLTKLN